MCAESRCSAVCSHPCLLQADWHCWCKRLASSEKHDAFLIVSAAGRSGDTAPILGSLAASYRHGRLVAVHFLV